MANELGTRCRRHVYKTVRDSKNGDTVLKPADERYIKKGKQHKTHRSKRLRDYRTQDTVE